MARRQRISKEEYIHDVGNVGLRWGKEREAYNKRVKQKMSQDKQNAQVDRADELQELLPKALRGDVSGQIADRIVDVQDFVRNPAVQANALIGGGIVGGLGLGAAGLQAYSDQANEYLPTGPLAVAGRTVSNLNPFKGQQVVGTDPLAEARNNVAQAADIVGTEAMLEALAVDQMAQMKSEREVISDAIGYEQISRVTRDMVDARARELMETPIQYSDGSVRPMRYDEALRHATEQVHMEMRANNVY